MEKNPLSLKKIVRISWGIILLGAALTLIGAVITKMRGDYEVPVLFYVGLAVVVAGCVFQVVKLRCPKCGCRLAGYTRVLPKHCPECGASLEEP